jgi:hypothetical protein
MPGWLAGRGFCVSCGIPEVRVRRKSCWIKSRDTAGTAFARHPYSPLFLSLALSRTAGSCSPNVWTTFEHVSVVRPPIQHAGEAALSPNSLPQPSTGMARCHQRAGALPQAWRGRRQATAPAHPFEHASQPPPQMLHSAHPGRLGTVAFLFAGESTSDS